MAQGIATMRFAKPQEDLFAYLARFDNVREWDPTVTEAEMLTSEPPALGSRFRVVVKFAGKENEWNYEIESFDAPNKFSIRAERGGTVTEDFLTVTSIPGGSQLIYDANVRLSGIAKLGDPILGILFKRLVKGAENGLREQLGPPPA